MPDESVEVPAPPLPFTLRAGPKGLRLTRYRLRTRGWVLLAIVALFSAVGAVGGDLLGGLLAGAAFLGLVVAVLLVGFVSLWFYARATITVTHTELVVRRIRRRVLPRSELADVIVGYFAPGNDPEPLPEVLFSTREGRTFAIVSTAYWPLDGLDQLLAALGVRARFEEPGDRRLLPFAQRRPFVLIALITLGLLMAIVATVVAVDTVRSHRREAAAERTERDWAAYARSHLTSDRFPGLYDASGHVSDVDTSGPLTFYADLAVQYAGPEVDAAGAASTWREVCAFGAGDSGLRVVARLAFVSGESQDTTRAVEVECDADERPLTAWLGDVQEHPLGRRVERVDVALERERPGLAVTLFLPDGADDTFAAAFDAACGASPDAGPLRITALARDEDRYVEDAGCEDTQVALEDWTGTGAGPA